MPSHETYRNEVRSWIQAHRDDPSIRSSVEAYSEALLVLWHLDLEPARGILQEGYAENPRGSHPWDPILILRCFLLMLLIKQTKINVWVKQDLRGSVVLQILAGLKEGEKTPGIGTHYDFMHRLHNGPYRLQCAHQTPPSEAEKRRAQSPMPKLSAAKKEDKVPKKKRCKKKGRRQKKEPASEAKAKATLSVTAQVVSALRECQTQPNPNDMLTRLSEMLFKVAVAVSAKKGLLGSLEGLNVQGDGSPLRTGANKKGKRTCDCPKRSHCDCPRIYQDPDANFGWDHYREVYFYGHHMYEIVCASEGHDLPLALYLDKGSTTDFTASLHTLERFRKQLRDQESQRVKIASISLDAGHDGEPIYDYLQGHNITPIIPLSKDAPATHPKRSDLSLSKRGVPLCPSGCEMAFHGLASSGEQVFVCPVKAKKRFACPNAPSDYPWYRCRPIDKLAPTVCIQTKDYPRLFPPLPRNHAQFKKLYAKRSGCERSFSMKKERFLLEQAKHRRKSFWTIRLYLIAILQHALAWVSKEDRQAFVNDLFDFKEVHPQAA